jgi:hypothetical protein
MLSLFFSVNKKGKKNQLPSLARFNGDVIDTGGNSKGSLIQGGGRIKLMYLQSSQLNFRSFGNHSLLVPV